MSQNIFKNCVLQAFCKTCWCLFLYVKAILYIFSLLHLLLKSRSECIFYSSSFRSIIDFTWVKGMILYLYLSRSFPMSWLFISGVQSIDASVTATILPMNIQGWFPLGLTGLISLQSRGLSRVFSSTTVQKHQFFGTQPSLWANCHIRTWPLEKP